MARKIAPIILVTLALTCLVFSLYRDLVRSSKGLVASLERQDGQAALGPTRSTSVFCGGVSGKPVEASSPAGPASDRGQTQHMEATRGSGLEALFKGDPFPGAGGSEPQGLMVFRDGGILDSWLPTNRHPGFSPSARQVSAAGQPPADVPRPDAAGSSIAGPTGGSSQDNVKSSNTQ